MFGCSGKTQTLVPERGRSTASGDAAAAAIASGFALTSDARSAAESAKKGTPSSPANEAPEGGRGAVTARAETTRRAGGQEGDRSAARDAAERGGARCARARGGAVAAATDIVEGADGQCGDRPRDNNKNIVVNLHRVLDRAVTTRGARLGMTRGRAGRGRGDKEKRLSQTIFPVPPKKEFPKNVTSRSLSTAPGTRHDPAFW